MLPKLIGKVENEALWVKELNESTPFLARGQDEENTLLAMVCVTHSFGCYFEERGRFYISVVTKGKRMSLSGLGKCLQM